MAAGIWTAYFLQNRTQLLAIDCDDPYVLTEAERGTITRSIQQFQIGEQSEGAYLIRLAERYAAQTRDVDYVRALKLFIAEEQRHAADLARFMARQGIPRRASDPVDRVFRWVRRVFTLEIAIVVLLSAEVIACTYYRALADATQSKTLRGICRQILRDEVQHLTFQRDTLGKLRAGRSAVGRWLTRWTEWLAFVGVLALVWHEHRGVYRTGGFSFGRFWSENWRRYRATFRG